MLAVNATEFQQNVGYYFSLAEKGEQIEIKKNKPKDSKPLVLKLATIQAPKKQSNRNMEILEKYIVRRNGDFEDGLAFQRRVRS